MSTAITQMAMAVIAKEQAEKHAKEQAELQTVIARREAEERSVMRQRVALEAERLMAAKEAERLVAEERAACAREAEEVALRAEIERLRNRSETEILRDEVASLRAEMAGMRQQTHTKEVVQESIYSHLRADGELDMRFRSSKQELSVVQQEVKELKSVVESLEQYLSLRYFYTRRNDCGNWDPKTFIIPAKNELFGDLAFGKRKTLIVNYMAAPPDRPGSGDLSSFSASAKENENLKIIVASLLNFTISSASWGAGGQMKDVTEIVKSMCQ